MSISVIRCFTFYLVASSVLITDNVYPKFRCRRRHNPTRIVPGLRRKSTKSQRCTYTGPTGQPVTLYVPRHDSTGSVGSVTVRSIGCRSTGDRYTCSGRV